MTHLADQKHKLVQLLAGFFRAKRSIQSLQFLCKWQTRGWEKWWQHELAMHLARSRQIAEWETEHRVPVANTGKRGPKHMYFDVAVKFKQHFPSQWFLLELKQSEDFRACLRQMKKDMKKFVTSDGEHLQGLGRMAYAGVVPGHEDDDEIKEYAEDLLEDMGIEKQHITIRHIGKHHKLVVI